MLDETRLSAAPQAAREAAPPPADPRGRPDSPPPEEGRRKRRRDILNLLNYINFNDGSIEIAFHQPQSGDRQLLPAFPEPCEGEILVCRWTSRGSYSARLAGYDCEGFLLSEGNSRIMVKAEPSRLDAEGVVFRLPEAGSERGRRKVERHACFGIECRLLQAGLGFGGRLVDFSADSFRLELEAGPGESFRWINRSAPVTVLLSRGEELLYSGDCIVSRMGGGAERRDLVLSPKPGPIRRYRPKVHRNERFVLSPAPVVRFIHPLTGHRVDLPVKDISGTGLSVEEFREHSALIPGLLIPELSVEIANQFVLASRAQVLYRNAISGPEEGAEIVRCGIVFLDMDPASQVKLSATLHRSADARLRICDKVALEELWRFFFETGFIYPEKYISIETRKEEFKRTYERLYLESPSIARHFLYQDKGRIFGHMSMLRYSSNTWLIHHHAASRDGYGQAGVKVLEEVGRYCNDFHSHPATHMDYLMCYYRPENRFPARVFGNIAKDIADLKGSSLDSFAYLREIPEVGEAEAAFQLYPACPEDFAELGRWYETASGGLAMEALDLSGGGGAEAELTLEYSRQGFKRQRTVFCLRSGGRLAAVMSLTLSDLGLNLSDLTSSVHAFVLDPRGLPPPVLFTGIRSLLRRYGAADLPALIYPCQYLDDNAVAYSKKYVLWVVSLERSDEYFESLRNTFRRACHDGDDRGNIGDRRAASL